MDLLQMFNRVTLKSIHEKINQIRLLKTQIITNYYFQDIGAAEIYSAEGEKSVVFYYHDTHFKRIFFYSADMEELEQLLQCISSTCVVDYISRVGEEPVGSMLKNCGFRKIDCYTKVVNTCIQEQMLKPQIVRLRYFCNQERIDFADRKDTDFLYSSINEIFNIYTDHLPTYGNLKKSIDERQVLVNRLHNKISGYIVFQITGKWSHFNYFYGSFEDNPTHSMSLLFAYYDLLIKMGVPYVYGWVREKNSQMLSIHSKFNYINSDIRDFVYLRGE